jgi:hypothetical protein
MPSPGDILSGLTSISNEAFDLAILWHALLALALVAIAQGWRPSPDAARMLLALPLASAATLAFAFGNPFNGVLLGGGAIALAAFAQPRQPAPVPQVATWQWCAGVAVLAYGWVYPHFLEGNILVYLYAAPVGLVPCPTLSVVIGLALMGGLATGVWGVVLSLLGLFYGAFGVARLGVTLDLGLLAGAITLAAGSMVSQSRVRTA